MPTADDGKRRRHHRKSAVALEYVPSERPAPRVTAQGRGELADAIIREARRAGVPIKEDRDLVALLMQLDLQQCIPPALYQAVAEILFFLYGLNEQWKAGHPPAAVREGEP